MRNVPRVLWLGGVLAIGAAFTVIIVSTVAIMGLLVLFLSGSALLDPPAPTRQFQTVELLLDQTEIPGRLRWSGGPWARVGSDKRGTPDSHMMSWEVRDREDEKASMTIHRYVSLEAAERKWPEWMNNPGNFDFGWTYTSSVADRVALQCNQHSDGSRHCEWVARYDEYLVFLLASISPDGVRFEDYAALVKAIDAKMNRYLNGRAGPAT